MMSKLTPKSLANIIKRYEVDLKFHPRLPESGNVIVDVSQGFVDVYWVFFKSSLRLSTFDFLKTNLDYYHLHIHQITPNGFRNIIYFVMLCYDIDILLLLIWSPNLRLN